MVQTKTAQTLSLLMTTLKTWTKSLNCILIWIVVISAPNCLRFQGILSATSRMFVLAVAIMAWTEVQSISFFNPGQIFGGF